MQNYKKTTNELNKSSKALELELAAHLQLVVCTACNTPSTTVTHFRSTKIYSTCKAAGKMKIHCLKFHYLQVIYNLTEIKERKSRLLQQL